MGKTPSSGVLEARANLKYPKPFLVVQPFTPKLSSEKFSEEASSDRMKRFKGPVRNLFGVKDYAEFYAEMQVPRQKLLLSSSNGGGLDRCWHFPDLQLVKKLEEFTTFAGEYMKGGAGSVGMLTKKWENYFALHGWTPETARLAACAHKAANATKDSTDPQKLRYLPLREKRAREETARGRIVKMINEYRGRACWKYLADFVHMCKAVVSGDIGSFDCAASRISDKVSELGPAGTMVSVRSTVSKDGSVMGRGS